MKGLADIYRLLERYGEAEPLLRRWLEMSDKMQPDAAALASGYVEHAFVLRKMDRKAEAAESEARAAVLSRSSKTHSKR